MAGCNEEEAVNAPLAISMDIYSSSISSSISLSSSRSINGLSSLSSSSMTFTSATSSSSSLSSLVSSSTSPLLHEGEVLMNPDFEMDITDSSSWRYTGWKPHYSSALYTPFEGRNRSGAVQIISKLDANDVGWVQRVTLEKNTPYVFSAWLKGEGITPNKVGANLSYFGDWHRTFGHSGKSQSLEGTFDWTPLSLTILSDSSGETSIACRLGYYNNTVKGTLWCDDFSVRKADMKKVAMGNIAVYIERQDFESVSAERIQDWVNHLDLAYHSLGELVGDFPYDGDVISILSKEEVTPFGYSGNPISVSRSSVTQFLPRLVNNDLGFGFLHELSHDFEFEGKWNFDGEHWANFKLQYIVETQDATVFVNNRYYTGDELKQFWKDRYDSQMGLYLSQGVYFQFNDCLTHTFVEIKDSIGWEPFKKAFSSFRALDDSWISSSHQEKFEKYLALLTKFSGIDVKSLISDDDYAAYIKYLNR